MVHEHFDRNKFTKQSVGIYTSCRVYTRFSSHLLSLNSSFDSASTIRIAIISRNYSNANHRIRRVRAFVMLERRRNQRARAGWKAREKCKSARAFLRKRKWKCAENRQNGRPPPLSAVACMARTSSTCRNLSSYEIFLQVPFRRDQWKLLVIPEHFLYLRPSRCDVRFPQHFILFAYPSVSA